MDSNYMKIPIDAQAERLTTFCYTGDELPEPINLFAQCNEAPVWQADHWPAALAALAQDVSLRMGVDPSIPCTAGLGGLCAVSDDRVQLQVKAYDKNWKESPRLWLANVGPPSVKKTPGHAEPLNQIYRVQAKWSEEYRDEAEQYDLENDIYKKAKGVYARKPDGKPPIQPQPPTWRRLLISDATVEGVARILEKNTHGLLNYQDELSGWFGSMDAYRKGGVSKDRGDWLKAYNGGPNIIDRVAHNLHVPNWSVSIIGGIQPDKMRDIAKNLDDDGLIQRFLFMPARPAERGTDRPPNIKVAQAWAKTLNQLTGVSGPLTIQLSSGAQQAIDDARKKLFYLGKNPTYSTGLQTALQKSEGQLARLTLLFHMATQPSEVEKIVPGETAQKAVAAMLRYFVPCSVWFHDNFLHENKDQQLTNRIASWILIEGIEDMTPREIYRSVRDLRGKENRRTLFSIMDQLEFAAWVSVSEYKGSEPSRWVVNPKVQERFSKERKAAFERREADREAFAKAMKTLRSETPLVTQGK
jgi:hypothetical protein